jgi:hypothetical protein
VIKLFDFSFSNDEERPVQDLTDMIQFLKKEGVHLFCLINNGLKKTSESSINKSLEMQPTTLLELFKEIIKDLLIFHKTKEEDFMKYGKN